MMVVTRKFFHHLEYTTTGFYTEYLVENSKVNGRYQILQSDLLFWGDKVAKIETSRWFWHETQYIKAYADVWMTSLETGEDTFVEKIWDTPGKEYYQKAYRSWVRVVTSYDTLSQICLLYETNMKEVMVQNNIVNPDKIYAGDLLVYDSRVNK